MNSTKATSSESTVYSATPDETFGIGEQIGAQLAGGEVVLLTGGLGAGKTLMTKGIARALDFDVDEVTSPSFALVNLYRAKFDVFHIDLWRIDEGIDAASVVGLYDLLDDRRAVIVIEWAEKLGQFSVDRPIIEIAIRGDGDDPREITICRRPYSSGAK